MKRALILTLVLVLVAAATAVAAPPANDDFSGLELAGENVSFAAGNAEATSQPGEDDHAAASRDPTCEETDPTCIKSVWWYWTAPRAGQVNVNLCRSDFDSTLAVYTGSNVASLTEVAANDDLDPTEDTDEEGGSSETTVPLNCPSNRTASGVEFAAVEGTTYRIAVAGFAGADGAIDGRLSYGPLGQLPPNPGRCSNRSAGSDSRDELAGTPFGDIIGGLSGNDRLGGGRGDDCLYGDPGNDAVDGGSGRDRVFGNSGRDRVVGNTGNDRVGGNTGNDRVDGGRGNDNVTGDRGNDRVSGGRGRDRVSGGPGRDRLSVRDGRRDRVDCGRGADRVRADRSDRLRRCERVLRR